MFGLRAGSAMRKKEGKGSWGQGAWGLGCESSERRGFRV